MPQPYVPLPQQPETPDYLSTIGRAYEVQGMRQAMAAHQAQQVRAQHDYQNQLKLEDAYRLPPQLMSRQTGGPVAPQDPAQMASAVAGRLRGVGTPEAWKEADTREQAGQEYTQRSLANHKADLEQKLDNGRVVLNSLYSVHSAEPAQKQTIYSRNRDALIQAGRLQPGSEADYGELYPGDDAIARDLHGTFTGVQQLEDEHKGVSEKLAADRFSWEKMSREAEQNALNQYRKAELGLRQQSNALGAQGNSLMNNQRLAGMATALRSDYMNDSKPFREMTQAFNMIKNVGSGTGVDDLALITAMMKLYDPGSTVREGEFANAANASGIPAGVRQFWNQMQLNPSYKLPSGTRKQFLEQSQKIYGQARKQHQQTVDNYSGMAQRSGLDPANVIVNYDTVQEQASAVAPKPKRWQDVKPIEMNNMITIRPEDLK